MDAAAKALETDLVIARLNAVAAALSALDAAQELGRRDIGEALHILRPALREQGQNPEVAARASAILVEWGRSEEARDALVQSLSAGGPDPRISRSLAWRLVECGDSNAARHWLAASIRRADPRAEVAIELALIEQQRGYSACAGRLFEAAAQLPLKDAARLAWLGEHFASLGRADLAELAYERAYAEGCRDLSFLVTYCWFLTRHMRYDRLVALGDDPAMGVVGHAGDLVRMFATQAWLARDLDLSRIEAALVAREQGARWIPIDQLAKRLRVVIDAAEPWSWVRLSDGEARFFIQAYPDIAPWLAPSGRRATANVIWDNWFGEDLATVEPYDLVQLATLLDAAVLDADLLGVTPVSRLRNDVDHRGYLAYLELLLAERWTTAPHVELCDALANYQLNDRLPLLEPLLRELPFLGVISPHPDLGDRLQRHFGIDTVSSYDIPGESRLDRPCDKLDRGTHFPEVFRDLLKRLAVPARGAVFLVAGGLLGKVYCHRIKALGGIAIDVGAIVDAWAGINSRGSILDQAMHRTLPP